MSAVKKKFSISASVSPYAKLKSGVLEGKLYPFRPEIRGHGDDFATDNISRVILSPKYTVSLDFKLSEWKSKRRQA